VSCELPSNINTEINNVIEDLKIGPQKLDMKRVDMVTREYVGAAKTTKETLDETHEDFEIISQATHNLDHSVEIFDKILNEIEDM
jgi:hypothetical protein